MIDPDVLWSCTTCGACVEQCPVDIEHVDHIVDMRRYQVMIESEFPSELGVLFRNLENKGNPWGQNARNRLDWTKDLPFEVPVYDGRAGRGDGVPVLDRLRGGVRRQGAEDRAGDRRAAAPRRRRLRRARSRRRPAPGIPPAGRATSSCSRCSRRRTSRCSTPCSRAATPGTRKIVTTCPHCFNTLGREYPQLDGHYEVVHHTQLLNTLVREGKLVPVAAPDRELDVTYHDPCYLGRHNEVYAEPRELVGASGVKLAEMPRHADRSFCCGAGGARMWMEEKIGKRVNLERVDEALGTGAEKIATGCPFCRVMFSDGLTQRQSEQQGTDVEILDVSQLLLAAVKRGDAAPPDARWTPSARARPGSRPLPCPARRSTAAGAVVGGDGGPRRRRLGGRRRHRRRVAEGRQPEPDRSRRRPAPLTWAAPAGARARRRCHTPPWSSHSG